MAKSIWILFLKCIKSGKRNNNKKLNWRILRWASREYKRTKRTRKKTEKSQARKIFFSFTSNFVFFLSFFIDPSYRKSHKFMIFVENDARKHFRFVQLHQETYEPRIQKKTWVCYWIWDFFSFVYVCQTFEWSLMCIATVQQLNKHNIKWNILNICYLCVLIASASSTSNKWWRSAPE